MTFHWATNYGAVLQSYALQHYLQTQGVETEIINYIPRNFTKTFFGCLLGNPKKYKTNFRELKKERAIRPFRQKHLRTTKLYSTHEELTAAVWDNGLYICGSDQIWNPYFTMQGEGKITLSYYLDFAPKGSKKVSYAASFGTTKLEMPMSKIVAEQLVSFDAISVRERSAVAMLERVGISAQLICDPVFLLSKSEWDEVLSEAYNDIPLGARLMPEDVIDIKPVNDVLYEKIKWIPKEGENNE
jgi:hypothetical protein